MVIVVVVGLANAGTAKATAASSTKVRNFRFRFINILPFETSESAIAGPTEETELTRGRRASSLARKTPILPGLTAGKIACHTPRGCHRGVFLCHIPKA